MRSHNRPTAAAGLLLVLIMAVAGCGTTATSSSTSTAPGIRFNGKSASIPLSSQFAGSTVPTAYTCDGHDESPPLGWGPLPAGTKQLVLFILGFTHSGQNTRILVRYALGLKPTLQELPGGKLPAGAVVGRSSGGHVKYSLCPPRGSTENYLFVLYAAPTDLHLRAHFNAVKLLGQLSPSSSPAIFGAFLAAYTRR